jgi:hypothetical protein
MKDLIIMIVAFVIVAAFVGHMEINLSPFSIKLPMWHRVVGLLFIIIGWIIWEQGERLDAYSKELKKGMDITIEQIKANKK